MTDEVARARRKAIMAEYSAEEAANAEAESLEAVGADADQAVLSVRVPASLSEALKVRAAEEHTSQSALVRRLLSQAVQHHEAESRVLTVADVEAIARRVVEQSRG